MFNTLLKSKFQIKCKSSIKVTNMQLELIKKKRIAMQKYLMDDIVNLLQNGLDSNAYARAGGFLEEMNVSSCYEYVELSCLCISTHLSAMCKDNRECPEDCREAVSTLMFAAARFGDLPELRELRSLFTERYGKSVESYVNKEFAAKLKSVSRSKDQKLQLLQDIAHESGIEWNSKALEQQLYKPPPVEQPPSIKQNAPKNISGSDRHEDDQMVISGERNQGFYSDGKDEVIYDCHEIPKSRRTPSKVIQAKKIGQNVWQSEVDPAILSREKVDGDESSSTGISVSPPNTSPTVSKTNPILDCLPNGSDTEGEGSRKLDVQLDKKSKEIPKSVRTRRAKLLDPPPGQDNIGSSEGNETSKNSDGKEQEDSKQYMSDLSNQEKRMIDKFLMHYSNKNATPESSKEETKARRKEYSFQSRAASLPVKPTSPEETKRAHTRATSYQTDRNANGYVHPMLPDYDDFVARLAAFRGDGR